MSKNADTEQDAHWMALALEQARQAQAAGEVPVGAVLVKDGQLIATGRNAPLADCDPSAHAELLALRAGARRLGNYRLNGCTLYVTLEPCPMCAGAMLHARLQRVVYGAADPKTGAAGSVLNLFAEPRLNHHTQLCAGVRAGEAAELLSQFFQQRRQAPRRQPPLREDALRTPEARFPPWPQAACRTWHALSELPALAGLRLHYLDSGAASTPAHGAQRCWLLVDSASGWSWRWRHLLPALASTGERVLAPDLIGFGRSDKPKREDWHSAQAHIQVLLELIDHLQLQQLLLVTQADWLQPLVQRAGPRCIGRLAVRLAPVPTAQAPWQAPYPDPGHRAGPRAFARWSLDAEPAKAAAAPLLQLDDPASADQAATWLRQQALAHFS